MTTQYLGIPLAAGAVTRVIALTTLSKKRRDQFFGYFGLLGMAGLLYVIIVLFMSQGRAIIDNIGTVFRICVPCVRSVPASALTNEGVADLHWPAHLSQSHHVLHHCVDHDVPVVLEVLAVALGLARGRIRQGRHASVYRRLKQRAPQSFSVCFLSRSR